MLHRLKLGSDIELAQKTIGDFYALEYMVRRGFPPVWDEDVRGFLKMELEDTKKEVIWILKQSLAYAIAHQFLLWGFRLVDAPIYRILKGYMDDDLEGIEDKDLDALLDRKNLLVEMGNEDGVTFNVIDTILNSEYTQFLSAIERDVCEIMLSLYKTNMFTFNSERQWQLLDDEDYFWTSSEVLEIVKSNFDIISDVTLSGASWWENNFNIFDFIKDKNNFEIDQVDYIIDLVHSVKRPILPHLTPVLDAKRNAETIGDLSQYVSSDIKKYVTNYDRLVQTYGIAKRKTMRYKISQDAEQQSDLVAYLTNLQDYLKRYSPFVLGNQNVASNKRRAFSINFLLNSVKESINNALNGARSLDVNAVKTHLTKAKRTMNMLNNNYLSSYSAEKFAQYGKELEESMDRFIARIHPEDVTIKEVTNLQSPMDTNELGRFINE